MLIQEIYYDSSSFNFH